MKTRIIVLATINTTVITYKDTSNTVNIGEKTSIDYIRTHSVNNWKITLIHDRQQVDRQETYIDIQEIKGHMQEGF